MIGKRNKKRLENEKTIVFKKIKTLTSLCVPSGVKVIKFFWLIDTYVFIKILIIINHYEALDLIV